jgi:SSS family solute:Na+ symporter
MLGLLALLGYIAIAAHVKPLAGFGNNGSVPALINATFPAWFAGFAFAAISIGALVPAAVMSIAAANLFTRNIYREYINRNPTDRQESQVAKWTSFFVKLGALIFIVYLPTQYVLNFQLLGGIWILQTLPSVFLGLYTNWFNRWALLVGWAAGMIVGTVFFVAAGLSAVYPVFGVLMYSAFSAFVLNLLLAIILTPVFEAIGARRGKDLTSPTDYDEDLAPVEPVEAGREALG